MKSIGKQIISITMLCTIVVTSAQAYSLNNWRLVDDLKYVPYEGFSSSSISQFNDALYTWNKELPNGPQMRRSTKTHNSTPHFIEEDGKNYIYRLPEFDSNSPYVATNRVLTESMGFGKPKRVVESDINFDVNKKFANSGKPGYYDVQSIFLHEAGHTLGLDHSSSSDAVMYKEATLGGEKRILTIDDRRGLEKAYSENKGRMVR